MQSTPSMQVLLDELERMPGVGPKSAARIAYWILNTDDDIVFRLADSITDAKKSITFCKQCFNYAENDLCDFCASGKRGVESICVVSEPKDITPIERSCAFSGSYHVLGGALCPMDGIGPDQLNIAALMSRLSSSEIEEVIIATNPNIEGETTASYLARLIKPLGIKVTRLASGLPVGGDLEYIDEVTLGRAIEDRKIM